VIAGDELRPGTSIADSDGGAIFKFIPTVLRASTGSISNLNDSPLTSGSVYALQVFVATNQFGQGGEIGQGRWITVNAATARRDADTNGATGYYRPEDLHQDPMYVDAANPQAVRVCWADTGNDDLSNYAEVMCAVDATPDSPSSSMIVNRLLEGDSDFNSFDNLEFQPVTGNIYVIEDHDNGDIFACLPDGADRDIKSDGCVKMLSVNDTSAEPTGFLFSEDGRTAYVSIQHSNDASMPLVDGYATDDVIKITGFRVKR
jgi:secreted PhoX family phosphatase